MKSIVKYIRKINWYTIFILLFYCLTYIGCNKLVESEPPSDYLSGENVYSTDFTATAVVNGIYIDMNANGQPFQGNFSIGLLAGLGADELTLYNGVTNYIYIGHYKNALSEELGSLTAGSEHWSPLYKFIFKCNAVVEGLNKAENLTPAIKRQLMGEVKFLRAYFYFYLVNLFGDVPLCLTTDPEVNTFLPRSSKSEVYLQIISDLLEAEENLSVDYLRETLLNTTNERVRPTKWAASAFLARVYLYIGDYAKAENKASVVINNVALFTLEQLNQVFLKNSREAIWQLQPTSINFNTVEAQTLIIPQGGPNINNNPVFLSDTLLNSFEAGDMRAKYGNWIDTTIYKLTASQNDTVAYANKYKLNLLDATITTSTGTSNMNEYYMMLRLAEQYLIRAEARARLGNLTDAVEDLNIIRERSGLTAFGVSTSLELLLSAILHERQVELFTEGAHRWLDLKRMDKIDEVMKGITPVKTGGDPWLLHQKLYPLPLLSDLQRAPNLVQNDGY